MEIVHGQIAEQVVWLEVNKIKPNPNQGRRYFDQKKLIQLAKSIKKEGQQVPIEVRPAENGFFEIIKGERRWRAHKIAKLELIKGIIIKENISDKQAKRKSVVDNHGREGHTTLETMDMIAEDLLEMKNDPNRPEEMKTMEVMIQEIADSFAKSVPWVYQHLKLFDLHKDVRKLLNPELPEDKRINFSTALAIAKVSDKFKQLDVADKVIKRKMTSKEAEHHCRTIAQNAGIQYGERKRLPSDDRRVLEGFIRRTADHVERYIDLCKRNGMAKKLFENSKTTDKKVFILEIKSCGERIRELAEALS